MEKIFFKLHQENCARKIEASEYLRKIENGVLPMKNSVNGSKNIDVANKYTGVTNFPQIYGKKAGASAVFPSER